MIPQNGRKEKWGGWVGGVGDYKELKMAGDTDFLHIPKHGADPRHGSGEA